MNARLIDRCEVLLLDQGRTFMFDNDRFGPDQNYYRTYLELGGHRLSRERLHDLVHRTVQYMTALGRDRHAFDHFPSIPLALPRSAPDVRLEDDDVERIDELISYHELGSISIRHARAIQSLARTHRLGIVSNIWGMGRPFEANLRKAQIYDCFEHIIWSSACGMIKPSLALFRHAMSLFGVLPSAICFVGDHPMRDVVPAKECGFSAVWVNTEAGSYPADHRPPDLTIRHLDELLEVPSMAP